MNNTAAFAEKIKKENRMGRGGSRLAVILFLLSVYMFDSWDVTSAYSNTNIPSKSGLNAGTIFIILYTVLLFTMKFYRQYLRITVGLSGASFHEDICEIAKNNAFDTKSYFQFIRKKLFVWQVVIFLCIITAGILHRDSMYFVLGFFAIAISFITGFLIQKNFEYKICNRVNIAFDVPGDILKGIICIIEVILICAYIIAIFAVILGCAAVDFDDSEIIYRTYTHLFVEFIVGICAILCGFTAVFYPEKKSTWRNLIFITILLVFLIIFSCNSYIDIRMDRIIVADFSGRDEYSFGEIESYVVYEDDDAIQVKLTFDNGKTVKLFSGMSLCTDAYTDAYYSEYNFTADLIRLISANGAEGSIKDIDALCSDVEGMDKELSEGLEEIIEFLGE